MKQNPEAIMVVLPADHLIEDTTEFLNSVSNAIVLAKEENLVTLGVSANVATSSILIFVPPTCPHPLIVARGHCAKTNTVFVNIVER